MKKEFIYNIFFLIVTNLLVKPLYIFGIETKVQNEIGPSAYGLYFSLYGLVFLWQFINEPGIQNYNAIYLSQNKDKAFEHIPRLLGIKIILFISFLTVSLLSGLIIGHNSISLYYIIGIVGIFFLSTLFVLLRTSLSSIGKYRIDTWLSSIDRLLLIVVISTLFLLQFRISVSSFILVQLACYLFCVIITLYFLRKEKISITPIFDFAYAKSLLKSSMPYALIILLVAGITRFDAVILERILPDGNYQAGLYAAGYRFVDAANMFGYLFGALLLPMYGNNIKNKIKVNELFDVSFRLLFTLSLIIASALFFYSKEIIQLFYNDAYNDAIPVMRILMISVIPIIFTHAFGSLIFTMKKIKEYNIMMIIIFIISIISNLVLIPIFKSQGAAFISTLSQFLILLGMIYITSKFNFLKISLDVFIKCISFFLLNVSVFYLIKNFTTINWIFMMIISSSISFLISLFIKLINIKSDLSSVS